MGRFKDTVGIADGGLRAEIEARHPELWSRITSRRSFMRDRLGIEVRDEVLPLSPTARYFMPFCLDPGRVLVFA